VDDVQAVIQILAETAFAHQRKKLDVGSSHDAHVNLELFRASEAHEFALLNHAQKLGLRLRANGGDFIEKIVPWSRLRTGPFWKLPRW